MCAGEFMAVGLRWSLANRTRTRAASSPDSRCYLTNYIGSGCPILKTRLRNQAHKGESPSESSDLEIHRLDGLNTDLSVEPRLMRFEFAHLDIADGNRRVQD